MVRLLSGFPEHLFLSQMFHSLLNVFQILYVLILKQHNFMMMYQHMFEKYRNSIDTNLPSSIFDRYYIFIFKNPLILFKLTTYILYWGHLLCFLFQNCQPSQNLFSSDGDTKINLWNIISLHSNKRQKENILIFFFRKDTRADTQTDRRSFLLVSSQRLFYKIGCILQA